MKKKIILLVLSFVLILGSLSSQNINKAYDYTKKKEHEKAIKILKKSIEKKKNIIAAKYGLALVYADTVYKKHNYSRAYKYLSYCEKKIIKSNEKDLLKDKYNITLDEIQRLKEMLVKSAYDDAVKIGSKKEFSKFIIRFKKTSFAVFAKKKIDSIDFFETQKKGTTKEFRRYIKFHKDSEYNKQAEKIIIDIEYSNAMESSSIVVLEKFLNLFPNSKQAETVWREKDYLIAKNSKEPDKALKKIIEKYPETTQAKKAEAEIIKIIYEDAKRRKSIVELKSIVKKYPNSYFAKKAENDIINIEYLISKNKKTIYALENFIKKYPNTSQAKQAKEEIIRLTYRQAKEKKSVNELKAFIKKYPASILTQRAENDIINMEYFKALNKSSVDALKSFIDKYPSSRYTADAKKDIIKIEYKATKKVGTENAYLDFINKYPNSNQAQKLLNIRKNEYYDSIMSLNLINGFNISDIERYENFIKEFAPRDAAFVLLQFLIKENIKDENWKIGIKTVLKYKDFFRNDKKYINLLKILEQEDKGLNPELMGKNLDIEGMEIAPAMTADGKLLYICNNVYDDENIFLSKKENNEWQKPEPIDELNTPTTNDAPLAVLADGNRLLLFISGDIYFSDRTAKGWTTKQKFPQINTRDWEADACLTADGNAIIFISKRFKSSKRKPWKTSYHGESDIYVSQKNVYGEWSMPVSIGSTINTLYDERGPFLHSDMRTLYFSSSGHGGLGGLDVYKTTRLNDTSWTEWSEPINLGKEINTVRDENFYKITTEGTYAYFSSDRNSSSKIYKIALPKEMRPENVTTISGKVIDNNENIIFAEIKWEDLETGELIGNLKSNPETGEYIIILPNGKNYGFFSEKENFYPFSGSIDLTQSNEAANLKQDIILTNIKDIIENEISISLRNIFFEFNKYGLKPESFPELDRFAGFLKSNPDLKVQISGHTDNKGSEKYNKTLSQNRANSIKEYLIKAGCNPEMITAKGFGAAKPITENETEEGRAKNRRVEFQIKK